MNRVISHGEVEAKYQIQDEARSVSNVSSARAGINVKLIPAAGENAGPSGLNDVGLDFVDMPAWVTGQ